MISLILAGWIYFAASAIDPAGVDSGGAYCKEEIVPGIYGPCAIKVGEEIDPEFGTPSDIWEWGTGTDAAFRWAGPPFCIEGWLPSAPEAISTDVGACRWRSIPLQSPAAPDELEILA